MIESVYIHIPFCVKKCKYCSFCSFNLIKKKNVYIEALLKEINYYYKNEKLKTLYFGGGTPSLLDENEIETILDCFNFDNQTEVTLELNPTNIEKGKLANLKSLGINRLSVGVQTFDNEILSEIGRLHKDNDVFETLEKIKEVGFNNFSIDLIYGLPNQDIKKWEKDLNTALELKPNHISLYGLKIEKGSEYFICPPKNIADDDLQAKMYELAIDKLSENYNHYEFSNFALKNELDYSSKHNLTYWNCGNYYGFGLSASGYIEDKRYTNTFNFRDYLNNPIIKKYDILSKQEQIEEEIFLGLRKTKGIDFEKINQKFNIDIEEYYKEQFNKFISLKLMTKTSAGIKLTKAGILVSNEVLCEFL